MRRLNLPLAYPDTTPHASMMRIVHRSFAGGTMRPTTSRGAERPGRVSLWVTAAVVVVGAMLAMLDDNDVADAWPAAVPRYECYCKNCSGEYFVCRNRDYNCNCAACSCYNDVHAASERTPHNRNGNDDDDGHDD